MHEYIIGKIVELKPTYLVIDNNSIGYIAQISLSSYSKLNIGDEDIKVYIHTEIKENDQILWAFENENERDFFRLIITANGVGTSRARSLLSHYSPDELKQIVIEENIKALCKIKGIADKGAKLIVISLMDKVKKIIKNDVNYKGTVVVLANNDSVKNNTNLLIEDEATQALIALGFNKAQAAASINKAITKVSGEYTTEMLIKEALRVG